MESHTSAPHLEVWKQPAYPDGNHPTGETSTVHQRRGSTEQTGHGQVIDYGHGYGTGNEHGYPGSRHHRMRDELEQRGKTHQRRFSLDQLTSCQSPRTGHSPRPYQSHSPSNSSLDGSQHASGDVIWKVIPIYVPAQCRWWSRESRSLLPPCPEGVEPSDPRDLSRNYIKMKQLMERESHFGESNLPPFHTNIMPAVSFGRSPSESHQLKQNIDPIPVNANDHLQSNENAPRASTIRKTPLPKSYPESQKYLDNIPNMYPHGTSITKLKRARTTPRSQPGNTSPQKVCIRGRKKEDTKLLYVEGIGREENQTDYDIEQGIKRWARDNGIILRSAHAINNWYSDLRVGCKINVLEADVDKLLRKSFWPDEITCRRWLTKEEKIHKQEIRKYNREREEDSNYRGRRYGRDRDYYDDNYDDSSRSYYSHNNGY